MSSRSNFPSFKMPRIATATSQILENNQRPLTRRQLHDKAHGLVAEAVAATCLWERKAVPLGDYHSVVFNAMPAPKVGVFVQLWSLPNAPVLLEVASGAEHLPTKQWLSPDLPARMERLGFEIGDWGNYQREFRIRSMRDVERMAHRVIDIFHDAFEYRGTVPIDVLVVSDGRASEAVVYDSFTPVDIAGIATGLGYDARILPAGTQDATATIALRSGATVVDVVLGDRVEDSNLYVSGFVGSPVVPAAAKRGARTALRRGKPRLRPDDWRVGVTLSFDGGVTAAWVAQRLEYGMGLVAATTRGTGGRAFRSQFDRSGSIAEHERYRSLFSLIRK